MVSEIWYQVEDNIELGNFLKSFLDPYFNAQF